MAGEARGCGSLPLLVRESRVAGRIRSPGGRASFGDAYGDPRCRSLGRPRCSTSSMRTGRCSRSRSSEQHILRIKRSLARQVCSLCSCFWDGQSDVGFCHQTKQRIFPALQVACGAVEWLSGLGRESARGGGQAGDLLGQLALWTEPASAMDALAEAPPRIPA